MHYRIPDYFFQRYSDKYYFIKLFYTKAKRYIVVHDLDLPFSNQPGVPAIPDFSVCVIEQEQAVAYINKLSKLFSRANLPLAAVALEIRDMASASVLEYLDLIIED